MLRTLGQLGALAYITGPISQNTLLEPENASSLSQNLFLVACGCEGDLDLFSWVQVLDVLCVESLMSHLENKNFIDEETEA